jgi:hypothetical protein
MVRHNLVGADVVSTREYLKKLIKTRGAPNGHPLLPERLARATPRKRILRGIRPLA